MGIPSGNPLHNVVHLIIGVAGLALIYGLFAVGNEDINFLNLNTADNFLHGASALVGFIMALAPVDSDSRRTETV